MQTIIRVYAFEAYKLNKYKNGLYDIDYDELIVPDEDELPATIANLANLLDVDRGAIFAHAMSGDLYVALIRDDYISVYNFLDEDLDSFAVIDANYCLESYGLLIESKKGVWKIVDE